MTMPMSATELDRHIAELSDTEQARIAADIAARLQGSDAGTEAAWAAEALRRHVEITQSGAATFDADDVIRDARLRLHRSK